MKIANSSAWLAILVISLALAACSASEPIRTNYSDQNNTTKYETQTLNTGLALASSNYGSSRHLELRALAECTGQYCTPETVDILFLVSSGSNPIRFPDRSLSIKTDSEEHTLTQQVRRRDANESSNVLRHLLTLEVEFDTFKELAYSSRFDAVLGSHRFSLDYDDRSLFRALVEATEMDGSEPATHVQQ